MVRTTGSDDSELRLLADIENHGWHCIHVMEEGDLPSFSYTIGLYETAGSPEFLVYGLSREVSHSILSIAADLALTGKAIDTTKPSYDLLNDYAARFVEVSLDHYREHLGFGIWYYEGSDFPAYQIVWPSRNGDYPWDVDATDGFRLAQPIIGRYASDA